MLQRQRLVVGKCISTNYNSLSFWKGLPKSLIKIKSSLSCDCVPKMICLRDNRIYAKFCGIQGLLVNWRIFFFFELHKLTFFLTIYLLFMCYCSLFICTVIIILPHPSCTSHFSYHREKNFASKRLVQHVLQIRTGVLTWIR